MREVPEAINDIATKAASAWTTSNGWLAMPDNTSGTNTRAFFAH